MKEYKIYEERIEISKKEAQNYKGSLWDYAADLSVREPYEVATFKTLEEAKKELKKYQGTSNLMGNYYLFNVYYIQVDYEDGCEIYEQARGDEYYELATLVSLKEAGEYEPLQDDIKELKEEDNQDDFVKKLIEEKEEQLNEIKEKYEKVVALLEKRLS